MLHLAANLSLMFTEMPPLDRFERAAKAGFTAVEYAFPYDLLASDIGARLKANGIRLVLINAPPGDLAAGDRGLAAMPGREAEFRDGFLRALDYAAALECRQIHVMAGVVAPGASMLTAATAYVANLAWAAGLAGKVGVKILLEPINHRDLPGYFLNTTHQAADIMAGLASEHIGLLFDFYHTQVTEGDVTRRLAELLPLISHIHVADAPGRNEPGTGEIGWAFVFQRIADLGYAGVVGCEYRPAAETETGLAWRAQFGV